MSVFPSPLSQVGRPHLHLAGERCPYCEQPIPNEKAELVRARVEARERELSESIAARLTQKFVSEKAQIEDGAKALVEQVRGEHAAALERLRGEIASREAAAREESARTSAAMFNSRLAEQERTSQILITALKEKLGEAEYGKDEAVGRAAALQADFEARLTRRLQEMRDALEADKSNALNAEKAKYFEEKQKLTSRLEDLARQLERKTAHELGEGAEVDLFEALKAEFDGDLIRRVPKGAAGADIVHEIVHNNRVCGTIVYDAKNRNAWRNDYVSKLREDQIAAKAEHAILAALKFPAERAQLCIQDGVIVANPARVVALVQMLRRHIVQVHTLRLSNNERELKTAALYDFIRSDRCHQLLERVDSQAENLLRLQEKEMKAHSDMWRRQGELFRGIQRTNGELTSEIDAIIGTGDDQDLSP